MMKTKRWYPVVIATVGAMLFSEGPTAQSFPSKAVRLLVPFAPGGKTLIATEMLVRAA